MSKISLDGHSQTAYTRKRLSESISFSSHFITSSGDAEPFVFSKINGDIGIKNSNNQYISMKRVKISF